MVLNPPHVQDSATFRFLERTPKMIGEAMPHYARVYAATLCRNCRQIMRPRGTPDTTLGVEHAAQHLCRTCHDAARPTRSASGRKANERTRDVVLDEYRFARDVLGIAPWHIAAHIGMNRYAFDRAMFRARAAGDPRAADWTGGGRH